MNKKKRLPFFQRSFAMFGLIMVVSTITLVGIVGFSFLDKQDNTEIAIQKAPEPIAVVDTVEDIETVTQQLDTTELDGLDAELDAEFDF